LWQKPKAGNRGQDRCEYFETAAIFHKFSFCFFLSLVLAFSDFSLENSFPAVVFCLP